MVRTTRANTISDIKPSQCLSIKQLAPIKDFDKHDDWVELYRKMRESGWTWKRGRGVVDYVYFNPGVNTTDDKQIDEDYFYSEDNHKFTLGITMDELVQRNLLSKRC